MTAELAGGGDSCPPLGDSGAGRTGAGGAGRFAPWWHLGRSQGGGTGTQPERWKGQNHPQRVFVLLAFLHPKYFPSHGSSSLEVVVSEDFPPAGPTLGDQRRKASVCYSHHI